MKHLLWRWRLPALTLFTFFFLLGSRSLNEPDEGRYSEIAREMIETGDWLVPHFWYLPHLDKPPLTYWLVAASMKLFGQNEWAVRLPVALAGVSGVMATWLLGCALGGRRVGFWSALMLQSSLLYFAMARALTPDILLTQFTAWAIYFFWRSWICLNSQFAIRNSQYLLWHLAGWTAIALGFLTKGPIALAIPLVAFVAIMVYRRHEIPGKEIFICGLGAGLLLFFALAAPWFVAVFQRVPQSAHYMIWGQAAGHLLGTTIKNREGSPFYFFGILAAGLLPWTILLGWLWRRTHWRTLDDRQKDGWLLLNVWAIFPFVLFSLSHAKLPAYILPIFPALAILLAWRFFNEDQADKMAAPWAWRCCLASALILPATIPLQVKFIFDAPLPGWLPWQTALAAGMAILILWLARKWRPSACAAGVTFLALSGLFITVAEVPRFETGLRDNQTLKPLGLALRKNFQPGDAVVCWGRLPQGLAVYSGGVISATHRPYFGGMDLTQVPFEFPGNRERLGELLLPNKNALAKLVATDRRVWIVSFSDAAELIVRARGDSPLRLVTRAGRWELYANR
jgi:4-amino-4-deoxy-L-arabinose transferase-like glycosyltransferase